MNVAGVNRIYYRLYVENQGGTLSGLQVLDVLNPALQNCQIEAAWRDTTNALPLTSIMGSVLQMQFPVGSPFQGGEIVRIIYSCEIPPVPISNQFTNDFSATATWGLSSQYTTGSNTVLAEIPEIFIQKWQRNDTSGAPSTGGLLVT